jgi:short-subunit dehydrogenase
MNAKKLSTYGSWALITGASDGIGRAFARDLAAAGVNVALVARRLDRLEELAAELERTAKVSTRIIDLDLSSESSHAELAQRTADLDIGILVAAAGFGTSGELTASDLAEELSMIDVNCRAVTAQVHEFGRRFVQRGRGAIILLSSIVAFQGVPRAANYAATKAFVQTLAEGLRPELGRRGVEVLSVAPAQVQSGFGRRAGMNIVSAPTPDVISRGALGALGRRGTVRPGFLAAFLELNLKLPRVLRTRIMALVMKGMTGH